MQKVVSAAAWYRERACRSDSQPERKMILISAGCEIDKGRNGG